MATFPRSVALRHILDGFGCVCQRVRPVDDRCDLSRFDEFLEDDHVVVVLAGDERLQLLAHEPGSQERPELPIGASEPPAASLASHDDKRSL